MYQVSFNFILSVKDKEWGGTHVDRNINFTIPMPLYNTKDIADMLTMIVKELKVELIDKIRELPSEEE